MPKQGIRPHVWITGPDPVLHKKYLAWMQQRNQAQWRGETWLLTFEQFVALWGESWSKRGRASDDFCMVRGDPEGIWDLNNVEIVTRKTHCQRHRARQTGKKRAIKL